MGSNKSGPRDRAVNAPTVARPAKASAPKASAKQAPPKKPEPAPLVVEVDGKPLPAADAEETWRAFSAHMDEHQGDLAGFAKLRGYKTVAPTYRRGSAVLLVTTR